MGDERLHESHNTIMHENIHVECIVDGEGEAEMECTDDMVFFSDGDLACPGDAEDACAHHDVWITHDEDGAFGELHEAGDGYKIIRIHKSQDGDFDMESRVEKIIIIDTDNVTDEL